MLHINSRPEKHRLRCSLAGDKVVVVWLQRHQICGIGAEFDTYFGLHSYVLISHPSTFWRGFWISVKVHCDLTESVSTAAHWPSTLLRLVVT